MFWSKTLKEKEKYNIEDICDKDYSILNLTNAVLVT